MPGPFSIFDQRLDIVVAKAGTKSHRCGFDFERSDGFIPGIQQTRPDQLIERVPKRRSASLALLFDPFHHVFVERDRRSDAHDASMLASKASILRAVSRSTPEKLLPTLV